ncbi:MAG: NUDIX hydrolase [Deltaproteobacteria bacterium]|nr:NUDIX hydrolase [Deltaproteobacteria bacterium]
MAKPCGCGVQKWQRLSQRTVWSCHYFEVSHETYRLPRGGDGDYHYVKLADSVFVVPVLDDGRLALVRQHRYLYQRASVEFPGGGIRGGASALEAAQAELREEAGFAAESWEPIGRYAPCNGITTETCHLFVARGLTEVGAAPEETEEMELVLLAPDELRRAIAKGQVWDGMTVAAFGLYRAWLEER